MGVFLLYIALYIIFAACPHGLGFTEKLKNHILDKRQYALNELQGVFVTTERGSEVKIDFDQPEVTPLANFTEPHHFNLFNKTFFFMGSRIYDQLTDKPTDNQEGYDIPRIEGNILFLRNVQFYDMGVILISFDTGVSNIYVLKNVTEPDYVHSLYHVTNLTDAKFFLIENSMYLVTINKNALKDSTIVYKWLGNHFDQTDFSPIEQPYGLTTFSLTNMEIIAVLHSSNPAEHIISLYEFDGSSLKTLQMLKTETAYRIFTYNFEEKIFMIIYGANDNLVYLWDRFAGEFVYHEQFQASGPILEELVESINGTQFLFLISNSTIQAYSSSDSKLKKLSQINFEKPYQHIGDATNIADDRTLYIYGQTETELELLTFHYLIRTIAIESSTTEEQCLTSLEDKLEQQLGIYWNQNPEPTTQSAEVVKAAYQSKEAKMYKATPRSEDVDFPELEPDYSPYDDMLNNIRQKMQNAAQKIAEMMQMSHEGPKNNKTVTGDNILVTGTLEAKRLSAENIMFNTIYNEPWEPKNWLSHTTSQEITGGITMNEMTTNSLQIPEKALQGALLKVGNLTITKTIQTKSLESSNLFVPVINDIAFDDIYLKNQPSLVTGMKQFKNLVTNNLEAGSLNGMKPGVPNISQVVFGSELKVENLEVETVDGVNWKEFKTSLFQLKNGTNITGKITFPKVTIDHLNAKRINGVAVEDFMTTSTDQHIKSKISFDHIEVENATSNKINGIDFKDVIQIQSNLTPTIVHGPVTIEKMNVLNSTFVRPDQDNWMYNNGHVMGTQQSDFLQRYNKKVNIMGNLHLKHLYLSGSKILLNNTEFKFEDSKKYWMKDANQNIGNVALKKLKVPNISIKSLNDIPLEEYMLNNNNDKSPTNYYFKNITILGNISLDDEMEHTPNLNELDDKIVRTTTCQKISGTKTFTGRVTTDEADVIYLDGYDTSAAATIHTEELSGKVIFDTIIITGNLTAEETTVKLVNNDTIKNLFDGVIMVDSKMKFDNLTIEDLYAAKLNITKLNGEDFNEYLKSVDQIHNITEITNFNIRRNGDINHLSNVYQINGVPYELIQKAVSNGAIMTGKVTFKDKVHIRNLTVKHMNNINIKDLVTKGLLLRNLKQTIFGKYRFNILKTPHLVAKEINAFNIETLVDVNKLEVQLMKGNFTMASSSFLGPITGGLRCDIKEVVKTLESPQTRTWQSVVIFKNTTVLQKENILSRIMDATVRLDKNNTITSPVTFNDNAVASRVTTTKDINNINIKEILEDALLASKDDQVVMGYNVFSDLSAETAVVDGDAKIPVINNFFDIKDIDDEILRKDLIHNTTIKGEKLFYGGLQAKVVKTSSLYGISPENFVNLDNLTQIPNVFFDNLHVQENFNINSVNKMNFYEFVDSRLLKNSDVVQNVSGKVFFENVEVKGPSTISKINSIVLSDVVCDKGIHNISSPKVFIHNLKIRGNVTIDTINNFNLTERYERSLLLDRSINILNDLILEGIASIDGNVTAKKINGIPIENIKLWIKSEQPKRKTEEVDLVLNQIKEILNSNAYYLQEMPEEYMYLEKSKTLQVQIPNTVSAQVVKTKNDIIMHVQGEESGDKCGLPNDCSCPVQYTLHMKPEPQFFPGKDLQRIFSFDTHNITVHLITNAISMSNQCKSNNSTLQNEYVILSWNLKTNNSSKTYMEGNFTSGYISAADFFTWNSEVYMVICVFYNPYLDSHNSHCQLFKFGNEGTEIQHVQTLPSKGAWSLHLFESPYQGLTLIIGNIYDSEKVISGTSTDIYYFNPKSLQFVHIKKIVGPGALSIADAVVGREVHIILAQKDSPLLIFYFDVMLRNYFLYQSINFDTPVTSVSTFYLGSKNNPDAYLNVVTESGRFYVYSYKHIEGWKLESKGAIDGLRSLIPFTFQQKTYLFAPSIHMSSLLTVKKHESN